MADKQKRTSSKTRTHGRGTSSNASGRYEPLARHTVDDGWDSLADLPPLKTEIALEAARTIITRNVSPDISFDRSINPYRGCEHGCVYCYARPTHAYMGLSPGLDFETKLFAKPNAAKLLRAELSKPSYEGETDRDRHQHRPLPADREDAADHARRAGGADGDEAPGADHHQIGHGVPGPRPAASHGQGPAGACDHLRHHAGPQACTHDGAARSDTAPQARRHRSGSTRRALPVSVNASPMIPALNDHELEAILEAAHEAGARGASYILLRMPLEVRDLFKAWLMEHHPGRYRHVISVLRAMRGGGRL